MMERYPPNRGDTPIDDDDGEWGLMLLDDIADSPGNAIIKEGERDADIISKFRSKLLFQCIHSRQETLGRKTFGQLTGAVIIAGERSAGEF